MISDALHKGTYLMNKLFHLLLLLSQVYHITLGAINLNLNFMKKKEVEKIEQSIPAPKNAQVEIYNTEGSITIKPWGQQKIALDIQKTGTLELVKGTTITSKVTLSDVLIRTNPKDEKSSAFVEYTVRVPKDISLKITQNTGPVTIQGIEGNIDISLEEGSIDIKGSKKTVTAKTGNGSISVEQTELGDPHSVFLQSSDKGNITVSLPPETRASLLATVQNGTISSDHPVTMTITTKLDRTWMDNFKKEIRGVLGKAKTQEELLALEDAAPITLGAGRGTIYIKEL
jgi:DUF4097 and DUF4098 domain-containing protein YvlB